MSSATRPPLGLRVAALLIAVVLGLPALYLIVRNFTEGADPGGLLLSSRVLQPLWRTVQLAVLVSLSAGVIGTATAWLTTRTDLPFARLFRTLLPLPLVYPTFVGAAALVRTLNPGGIVNDLLTGLGLDRTPQLDGLLGAWLVLTLFTYPYVHLPVAARMIGLPGSLEQSALLLGDSSFTVFRRIVLPQISRAITAGMLLVFLYAISDFGAVAILRYDTLTRAIDTNLGVFNEAVALALSLILLALAALVVLAERAASHGDDAPPTRGQSTPMLPLGRLRVPAALSIGFLLLNALGAPLVALIEWSVRGLRRSASGGRSLTVTTGEVAEVTVNTFAVSLVSALVAVLIVMPIALLVGRHRSRAGSFGHAMVISTFALPGILIALAARFWVLDAPDVIFELLNDSHLLLVFGYVIRFAALAMGTTLIAVQAVPPRLRDAAHTLGASPRRRLRTVDVPVMAPGLFAAGGLVLLSTMKELPITLILAPIGFQTLSTKIFGSFSESFVAEAGLMAIVLVAISFVAAWFLIVRNHDARRGPENSHAA